MDRKNLFRRSSLFVLFLFVCMMLVPLVFADGIYAATPQISADNHTVTLNSDGTLWAWGGNDFGQLGSGDTNDRNSPVQIGTDTDWVFVSAGAFHTSAIKNDGTVWTWGRNSGGQLGRTSNETCAGLPCSTSPAQVTMPNGVLITEVASGYNFTIALSNANTVYTWGNGGCGQIGRPPTGTCPGGPCSPTPGQVTGLTNISSIAAGGEHAVVLTNGGVVYTWGRNWFGAIGNGFANNTCQTVPYQVIGIPAMTKIAPGAHFTLALDGSQNVWAWGSNSDGQFGDGTTVDSTTPIQVFIALGNPLTGINDIVGGGDHTVAIKSDGTLWTWGRNDYGQLGRDSGTETCPGHGACSRTPTQVGTGNNWSSIASRGVHTVALDNSGNLWTWGSEEFGQLGRESYPLTCNITSAFPPYTAPCSPTPDMITYTVTTAAGSNGSISPTSEQTHFNLLGSFPAALTFTLFPNPGYYSLTAGGCNGSHSGNSYTTGPITAACTVTATFAPCTYSVPSSSFHYNENGGDGLFMLDASADNCQWSITFPLDPTPGWVGMNSPIDGSGDSIVDFTVVPNWSSIPRSGFIDIFSPLSTDPVASVGVSQDGRPCNFAINPFKTVLPSSGGTGFKVSVMAFADDCQWSVSNIPAWIQIVSPITPVTGNGVVTFSALANNTGVKRTGTMTIAGQTFTIEQGDNSLQETLVVPASGDTWVTATITNNTGQPLVTAKPTCCNTYFWITDSSGNMVPPIDRVCDPVGIPDSLVSIAAGGSFEIRCDLSEVAQLPQGTVNVMATYVNPLTFDPHFSGGGCNADGINLGRTACFDLKPVVIPSGFAEVTFGSSVSARKNLATLAFNPQQWDVQWATVNGPTITAQISGLSCAAVNSSSIKMNGQAGIVPGSCQDTTGGILVKFDRSAAVRSLGSVVPGTTAYVTVQGAILAGGIFYGQGSVDLVMVTGTLVVESYLHTVGTGPKPLTSKAPISGMVTRVLEKACASQYGMSWQNYPAIYNNTMNYENCKNPSEKVTDGSGKALFTLPPGDYIVIGSYTSGGTTIYPGGNVATIKAGSNGNTYLQLIQTADGQLLPAKYQKFTGSLLLVIEPEYVEWSGTQELYPFIFESLGDWSVITSVTPPEGFVADQPSLSTDVNSELTALQFTVTDVGSKWVSTGVSHNIKHKGKTIKVKSKIGLKLSPVLQKKLGLGEFGEEE